MYDNDTWRSPQFGEAFVTPYDAYNPMADLGPLAPRADRPSYGGVPHHQLVPARPLVSGGGGGMYQPEYGVSLATEVELGPTTLTAINGVKRTLDTKLDLAVNELTAALKLMGLGVAVAGVAIGFGLALKK